MKAAMEREVCTNCFNSRYHHISGAQKEKGRHKRCANYTSTSSNAKVMQCVYLPSKLHSSAPFCTPQVRVVGDQIVIDEQSVVLDAPTSEPNALGLNAATEQGHITSASCITALRYYFHIIVRSDVNKIQTALPLKSGQVLKLMSFMMYVGILGCY